MKFFLSIIRGAVIGLANVIPGVSGGTMMMSMGIYDKLIGAINGLRKSFKKSILVLLPIGIGMLVGIIGASYTIEIAFDRFPIPTALFFIGLIFGGLPLIVKNIRWKRIEHKEYDDDRPAEYHPRPTVGENVACVISFIFAFALIIVLEVLGQKEGLDKSLGFSVVNMIIALFLGIIAAATMIIPGVSGSMVMMIFGYYNAIIGLVTDTVDGLRTGNMNLLLTSIGVLIPFAIGALIGIFGIADVIEKLMKNAKRPTFSAILGLMLAAPFSIYMESNITEWPILMIGIGAAAFVLGMFISLKLGDKN